jgi:hypothetical protein
MTQEQPPDEPADRARESAADEELCAAARTALERLG